MPRTLLPLTEIFPKDRVVACSCGSTAFFDWCVQVVAARDFVGPRSKDYTEAFNARICVECLKPIVVYDGTAYDASMYVTDEQVRALIRYGQARQTAVPVRAMDP